MRTFAAVLAALVVGSGAVLLLSNRDWQTVTTVRAHPFGDDVLGVSGRTVDGAITALALVALAGVVAVIATRGVVRRVVGALVLLAGIGLVWRVAAALPAVSTARATALVHAAHPQVTGVVHVATHPAWGVLTLAASALVIAAGAVTAWRGAGWAALSQRYERQDPDPEQQRARADASLWIALDSGDDPTARDPGVEP